MNGQPFDALVSSLQTATGRRSIARGLGVLALAGVGLATVSGGASANKKERCMDRCKAHCEDGLSNRECKDRCRRRCEDR